MMRIAFLLWILLLHFTGCESMVKQVDPAGWRYVHSKGDAKAITEWALRQHDVDRVMHAQLALSDSIRNGNDAESAIEGLLAIHAKLATGWPDLRADASSLENRMIATYGLLAGEAEHESRAVVAFDAVRPPESKSRLYGKWLEFSEHLAAKNLRTVERS